MTETKPPVKTGVIQKMYLSDEAGSLSVEALLVLPVLILLIALFLRWGLVLREEMQNTSEEIRKRTSTQGDGRQNDAESEEEEWKGLGFLSAGPPARRIRDADLLIDIGYELKEMLPVWLRGQSKAESE